MDNCAVITARLILRHIYLFHLSRDHKDNPFGDIGNPVRNAFQVVGHPGEIGSHMDDPWVLHHQHQEFPVNLVMKGVDLIILIADTPCRLRIPIDKRLETFIQHGESYLGHPGDIYQWFYQWFVTH